MLTARTRRAKNRLAEHHLVVVRQATFNGQPAVLTRCVNSGCGWLGWFTADEARIDDRPLGRVPNTGRGTDESWSASHRGSPSPVGDRPCGSHSTPTCPHG